VLGGVKVEAATNMPDDASQTFPVAYLVQTRASRKDLVSGTLSGDLEAVYLRSAHHKALDADKIERELEDRGVRLSVHPMSSTDDRDVLRFTVKSAWPEIPEIDPAASVNLNWFAQVWKGSLHSGVVSGARDARKVSDVTDDDGTRLQVLEVELTSVNRKGGIVYTSSEHIDLLTSEVERRIGYWCYSGAGRLIDADVIGNEPAGINQGKPFGGAVKVRMTFESKVAK
jgi:hypothetical protein